MRITKFLAGGLLATGIAILGSVTFAPHASADIEATVTENGYCTILAIVESESEPEVLNFRYNERLISGIIPEKAALEVKAEPYTEPQLRYLGSYRITGYDTCVKCCGKDDAITASGTIAEVGRTCAASKDLPFGTVLYIDGIGYRTVEDRGGAINGNRIDVLCADHPACYAITGWYDVYIVEG